MNRREFLHMVAAAAAAGLAVDSRAALERADGTAFYDAVSAVRQREPAAFH